MEKTLIAIDLGGYVELAVGKVIEIQLLKPGEFTHPVHGKMKFDDEIFDKAIENNEKGIPQKEIAFNYNHRGSDIAAGWFKKLFKKAGGLFAMIEFTKSAIEKIKEKELRFVSAEFFKNYEDEQGGKHGFAIVGGALTNIPFLTNMDPVVLSKDNYVSFTEYTNELEKENLMKELLEKIQKLLGVTDDKNILEKITELAKRPEPKNVSLEDKEIQVALEKRDDKIDKLTTTVTLLSNQLEKTTDFMKVTQDASRKKELDKLVEDRYMTPAQLEKVEAAYCALDAETFKTMIESQRAGVQHDLTKTNGKDSDEDPLKSKDVETQVTAKINQLMKDDKLDHRQALERMNETEPELMEKYNEASTVIV